MKLREKFLSVWFVGSLVLGLGIGFVAADAIEEYRGTLTIGGDIDTSAIVLGGANTASVDLGTSVVMQAPDGTAAAPSYSFASGDGDNGFYLTSTDVVAVSAGGAEAFRWDSGGANSLSGSAAAPSYSFTSGLTTGLYYAGSNNMGFAANGTADLIISDNVIGVSAGTDINVGDEVGWTGASGADTACTTTCTAGCLAGFDTGSSVFVSCSDATADTCLCDG